MVHVTVTKVVVVMQKYYTQLHAGIEESADLRDSLKEYEANIDLPASVQFGLQHFSYNNSGVIDLIFNHLTRTEFTGITVSMLKIVDTLVAL